jgi:phage terminase large subunit
MLENKTVGFEIHKTHVPLWKDTSWRYAILMGGRGNGRSGTASRYVVSQLLGKEYTRGAIMRATREDIRASCWGEIIDRLNEQKIQSSFHVVDNDMFIERGQNSLRAHGFRASSGSLTARLKSLAGYNLVWIEEAEEIGEEEFRTLDDTLRTVKGNIRIVFTLNTPPKNHWILKKWFDLIPTDTQGFYTPKLKSEIKDVLYIPGTWRENEPNLDKHTIERYQAYKFNNPSYYWQVVEGLSPEEVRGKIYSGWQLIDAVPQDARLVKFGVDWGWYPDPLAIVAVYYYNGGYIVDEVIFGTNIEDLMAANAIKSVTGWKTVSAVCGSDEPKSIEVLKKYGIQAEKTIAGPGSVEYRIKTTAAKKIFVTRRSVNVWSSYENYAWAEDRDGNPKGEPSHYLSDCMDAASYAISSINPMQEYIIPRPQPTREKVNKGL